MFRSALWKVFFMAGVLSLSLAGFLLNMHLGEEQGNILLQLVLEQGPFGSLTSAVVQSMGDGRTPGYALRWLSFWWGVGVVPLSLFGCYILAGRGLQVQSRKKRRGNSLIDLVEGQRQDKEELALVRWRVAGLHLAIGFALWLCIVRVWSGSAWPFLPWYVLVSLADTCESCRFLLQGDHPFQGAMWLNAPLEPGWYGISETHGMLRSIFDYPVLSMFGGSFLLVIVLWILGARGQRYTWEWLQDDSSDSEGWRARLTGWLRERLRMVPSSELISLAQVSVPAKVFQSHVVVCGGTGAGKSVAIKSILDQVRERGEKAIICDLSGEYIESFYREGYDYLLSPSDARSVAWSLRSEVERAIHYNELGGSLYPNRGGGDAAEFFQTAAAKVFAAVTRALQDAPTSKVYEWLSGQRTLEEVRELLKETGIGKEALALLSDARMGNNILGTVSNGITPLQFLPDVQEGTKAFSIRRYILEEEDDRWLFIATTADEEKTLRPLLSLWCDTAARTILSRPTTDPLTHWFVFDEIASLQFLPALAPLAERSRKHGGQLVLGLQGTRQLHHRYGRDGGAAILLQLQTWVALRTTDPECADDLQKRYGDVEGTEAQMSYSMGANAVRDGVSLGQQDRRRVVVNATDFQTLPVLEGYTIVPGDTNIYRVRYIPKNRPSIARPFVPRNGGRRGGAKVKQGAGGVLRSLVD